MADVQKHKTVTPDTTFTVPSVGKATKGTLLDVGERSWFGVNISKHIVSEVNKTSFHKLNEVL